MKRQLIGIVLILAGCGEGLAQEAEVSPWYRLYDGITAFIVNPHGKEFTVDCHVKDINFLEVGPREVLVKIYDPQGKAVVREVIPDDGIAGGDTEVAAGGWDHLAWLLAYSYQRGSTPLVRWRQFHDPRRLAAIPQRTFRYRVTGPPGIYRMLIVGCPDHFVSFRLSPALRFGVAGHPYFLWVNPQQQRKLFFYVPQGATGLNIVLSDLDWPSAGTWTLRTAQGEILYRRSIQGLMTPDALTLTDAPKQQGTVLTWECTGRDEAYLLDCKWTYPQQKQIRYRGTYAVAAVACPDEETARQIQNGALSEDGEVFWQPFQIQLHRWLRKHTPQDEADPPQALKPRDFLPVNGPYFPSPPCDLLLHSYLEKPDPRLLRAAIRDLAQGLRSIGPNDLPNVTLGYFANMAYEFGNYAWLNWRPAYLLLQRVDDAPEEVKQLVREAMLVCGDRLAFCRSWERVNGNAFAQIVSALAYCSRATQDPLQKELFTTYLQRFATGGWGPRVGIGPSGFCQEGFGYDHHYGSYILATWPAVLRDLKDPQMQQIYDRIRLGYSYTMNEESPANPWSSRTQYPPHRPIEREGPFAWKGLPGPDFTTSVNEGNEWFAARRSRYYILTYHGRLTPKWAGNAFLGQIGYGGGAICQFHIPGHGTVLDSRLAGDYGRGMHPSQWRQFHLHAVVGQMVDGRPLVTADSEHPNARLEGNVVRSSGEVRDAPVHVFRQYEYHPDAVQCTVRLAATEFRPLLDLWIPHPQRSQIAEAYEMIPYLPLQVAKKGQKAPPTTVTAEDAAGKSLGPLPADRVVRTRKIRIDRGGFGVWIELDHERPVRLGSNHTLLIVLTEQPTEADKIALSYRIVPFVP
jgi:hypothetical protein